MATINTLKVNGETSTIGANTVVFADQDSLQSKFNSGQLKGEKGDKGDTPSIKIGTITKGEVPSATITGSGTQLTLDLTLPKGDKGDTGNTGATPNLTIGTVVTSTVSGASIGGTVDEPVLNLTLKKGDKGDKGDNGDVSLEVGKIQPVLNDTIWLETLEVNSGDSNIAKSRLNISDNKGGYKSHHIETETVLITDLPNIVLHRNTTYQVGDIAYSKNLPSYLRLECVKAGTTAATGPSYSSLEVGQYITDGTVTWILTDVRDGTQVGDIKMSPILRKGYVKANGALLTNARENYPRLVAFVEDNPSLLAADDTAWNSNKALYVYDDTNNTLRVPDAIGRVLQGGNTVEEKEAGLPNIEGDIHPTIHATSAISLITATYTDNAFVANKTITGAIANIKTETSNIIDGLSFDASNYNPIYGNSTTVQPPAITLIPQIKY